jgi:hypothetical protein
LTEGRLTGDRMALYDADKSSVCQPYAESIVVLKSNNKTYRAHPVNR